MHEGRNMQASNQINLEQIKSLAAAQACFSTLNEQELYELIFLFTLSHFEVGDVVVAQGDLVDRVYIILEGDAEVIIKNHDDTASYPLANLHPGDAIGLGKLGFFSQIGERTATVIAKTPLTLLQLTLDDLHLFIEKYPHIGLSMEKIRDEVQLTQFLKTVAPFSKLSLPRLHKLTHQVTYHDYTAGEIIFKQGEKADRCFLLQQGEVEIALETPESDRKILATLKPGAIFGELAVLTNGVRNATAKALTNTHVLAIKRDELLQLITQEHSTIDSFTLMMMERVRPIQKNNIEIHKRMTAEGQPIITLKDTINAQYFRLSEQGWFIWQQLNGRNTLREIIMNYFRKFHEFAPDPICSLIMQLVEAGFAEMPILAIASENKAAPWWARLIDNVRRIMEKQFSLENTDSLLSNFYSSFGHFFFNKSSQIIMFILGLGGCILFFYHAHSAEAILRQEQNTALLFLLLIPATLLSIPIHELAHAMVVKHFGREVRRMGIGWYWVTLIAFADTSDMWLGNRQERTLVNVAGIYIDFVLAGSAAILSVLLSNNDFISAYLWLLCLTTYINIFRNLSPLLEYDGYYILMDLLDKPNLRQNAVNWLITQFPHIFVDKAVILQHKAEIIYWLSFIGYLVCMLAFVLFIQQFVLVGILPAPIASPLGTHYRWALPLVAVVLSILSVYVEIKHTKRQLA